MGRFFVWLSGARRETLARCPGERAKYMGIGSAVFITSAMAAVSATFALHTALKAALPVAIPFAVAWGLAIMSLDRWLVVSLQRQDNPWRYVPLAAVRLALAVLFGFIISTPFVLQIFRPEIEQAITRIHAQQTNAFAKQEATSSFARQIARERARVANLEATIRSGVPGQNPAQNAAVKSLGGQLAQAKQQAAKDYAQWQCQLYGISSGGGHCQAGNGPLASASHMRYLNDEAQVKKLTVEISGQEGQIIAANKRASQKAMTQAQLQLPTAKNALRRDLATQVFEEATFQQANAANSGLLIRLEALDLASGRSSTLGWARFLLFLFFTVIECLPVLVKLLLNLGPENTYERMLAAQQKTSLRLSDERELRRRLAGRIAADAITDDAQRLADARRAVSAELDQEMQAAARRVGYVRLRQWERQERHDIAADGVRIPSRRPRLLARLVAWLHDWRRRVFQGGGTDPQREAPYRAPYAAD